MLQPRGEPDLAQEALRPERGGELRMQHLERDRPVVLRSSRQVDRGHAAAARARARPGSGPPRERDEQRGGSPGFDAGLPNGTLRREPGLERTAARVRRLRRSDGPRWP